MVLPILTFSRPVSTACGHSFCRDCLARSLEVKSECPTCRAPCSMLQVNIVLSSLLESQYPNEYIRRKEEKIANAQRLVDGNPSRGIVLPIVLLPHAVHSRFYPGSVIEVSIPPESKELVDGAVRFARDSGSNKVCVMAVSEENLRSLGAIGRVETYMNGTINILTEIRCELLQSYELDESGSHYRGKVRQVSDDEIPDNDRVVDTLIQTKTELNRKVLLPLGDAGTFQLLSRISLLHPGLLGSVERTFVSSNDLFELRRVLQNYNSMEKLSFFLASLMPFDEGTRHLLVDVRDTQRRIDTVLARLRSSVSQSSNIVAVGLLRVNSRLSAFVFLLLVILVLLIKGSGYLEFTTRAYTNKYR